MVFRRLYPVVALVALVATSGCFWHRCCYFHRPCCAPATCGCEGTSAYQPVVVAPTPAPPLVKGPPIFEGR